MPLLNCLLDQLHTSKYYVAAQTASHLLNITVLRHDRSVARSAYLGPMHILTLLLYTLLSSLL
jgi:hypothetical protein